MALRYDPASQVTNILHQMVSSATQINQAAYAYNPVGNRTSLTDRRGAQAFGYDSWIGSHQPAIRSTPRRRLLPMTRWGIAGHRKEVGIFV